MKKLYSILTALLFTGVCSQNITIPPSNISNTENYVYTRNYLAETSVSSNTVPQIQSVTYFDGLGREKQTIDIKASPLGKDVVTKIEYDALGRQVLDFLPMPQHNTTNGGIYSSATVPYTESVGNPLYGGTAPFFSKNEIEYSPLNRPLSSMAPGAWSVNNKKVTIDYKFNNDGEVKKYSTSGSALIISGSYAANQLYKTITTDEDNNVSIEFRDKLGKIILVRKQISATENPDTYYVYNEYHDLAFVISPLASAKSTLTSTDLNELCYQYHYDDKNRLIEKRIPGKGWEHMVYDNQDRLVMTQDANQRDQNQWLFTKYDKFGRVAYTGITTYSDSRSSLQSIFNGKGSNNVERTNSVGFSASGLSVYYDNTTANNYPNTITKLLSVNYYDTYPTGTPAIPANILSQTVLPQTGSLSTKSLPTSYFVNNIENNGWTKTFIWYDAKGRTIGTHGINYLGGYTKTETLLDFTGVPQKTNTYHKRRNTDTELLVKEEFGYDSQNRLLTHTHEVAGKTTKEQLVKNHYNEIGQLDWKKVGGTSESYLQQIDYAYNIRGWLTQINNPANLGKKLFAYKIKYENPENESLAPKKFNGNISEIDWISKDGSLKRYGYQYDRLNRLLRGNYQDPGSTVPESHINDEVLTYDSNGNIKTLVRNAKHAKSYTPVVIDNLDYNLYQGNKILRINDLSNNISGYEGGNGLIEYDANGNMTKMPDKGITQTTLYNYLNLPTQIKQNTNTTNYYYRADGVKVKKKYTLVNSSGTSVINTEYLDDFQYSTPNTEPLRMALQQTDDATVEAASAGEQEAFTTLEDRQIATDPGTPEVENMILSFFPTAEGYYDYENFRYIYQYKDHLGNVRVSYVKQNNELKIMDTNDYYPFGMSFLKPFGQVSVYDPMAIPYNYKYNGKELQETGMYDYGARFYMPDIARWGTHDPLSEITFEPYSYVYNNPIFFNDPTGMEGEESASGDGGGSGGEAGSGGCCPDGATKGASFEGRDYDGGVKQLISWSDGVSGADIETVNLKGKSGNGDSGTIPAPGSFTFGGGGGGKKLKSASMDYKGRQVLKQEEPFMWGVFGGRTWTDPDIGTTYNVGSDGKITGIAPYAGVVDIGTAGSFNILKAFKSSISMFKGGKSLTNVGRAVTKHPQYFGFESTEALMKVYKSPEVINKLGSAAIKDILRNGVKTTGAGGRYPNGWVTYTLKNGNAASWSLEGTFIGFRGVK